MTMTTNVRITIMIIMNMMLARQRQEEGLRCLELQQQSRNEIRAATSLRWASCHTWLW